MWQNLRKLITLHYSRRFNHSSYELELWCEYSSIILLHSQGILSSTHFQYGWDMLPCIRKLPFYGLILAVHCSGEKLCYSFICPILPAYKPSQKARAFEALEWWQFEKWQKIEFSMKWSLFSDPVIYRHNAVEQQWSMWKLQNVNIVLTEAWTVFDTLEKLKCSVSYQN